MLKEFLALILVVTLLALSAYAGTTGKVTGVVKDKDTGEPLVGANVMIIGTMLGAVTDLDGRYTILNVQVGEHSVRATYIGFQSMVQQNLYVNIDLTTTVDFDMVSSAIEVDEVVIIAERPLLRKDETNTNIIRTAEEIQNVPVRGIQDLAAMTAGVVKTETGNAMNIRGGRGNETATYVDGVLVTDPYNAAMRLYIPTQAIEEISVQTGGFNAEYGEAMSGILAVTTRAGKDRYKFTLEAMTDEFLSADKKNLGTYSYGFNEYIATVSGPIIPKKHHTFFISATRNYRADWTPSWGWAESDWRLDDYTYYQPLTSTRRDSAGAFVVDTLRHDYKFNARIPANHSEDWSFTGKIRLQLRNNMELKGSIISTDRTYSADWFGFAIGIQPVRFLNTDHRPLMITFGRSLNATFTHLVTPKMFYDLKLNYYDTGRKCYDPVFKDDFSKYGDPKYNPWPDSSIYYGEAFTGRIDPDFFQPGCQYDGYNKQRSTHWAIDFDVTAQAWKYHTIKAGVEYKYHTVRSYRMAVPSRYSDPDWETDLEKFRGTDIRIYGYDVVGNEVNDGDYLTDVTRDSAGIPISGFYKQKPYHPIVMSAYFQDKIEFEDLILNLGLRFDHVNPNAWMFRELAAQFNPDGTPITGTGMFGGDQIFDQRDTRPSESYSYLSPRVGFAFPVTDRTVFHAQYGKFYQAPRLIDLYLSPFFMDTYVNTGGYFTWLNNPNIRPPKTTSYEIGFKQTLTDYAFLQLTAFYKETEDLIQMIPITTDVKTIAFMENGDFGAIKGLDLIINLRRYRNLSLQLNYELQFARGTGSASNSNYDIAWQRGTRGQYPKFAMPLDFEQRHTGNLNVDYRFGPEEAPKLLRNSGVNLVFSFNSGNPYTRMALTGKFPFSGRYDNDNVSAIPSTAVGNETTPWMYRIDLKIDKQIRLMNSRITFYAWVINLLNTRNVPDVWITSGLPDDTGYLRTSAGRSYWDSIDTTEQHLYKMREIDYNYFGLPRQIRLGIQMEI